MVSQKPKYCNKKTLKEIVTGEKYYNGMRALLYKRFSKTRILFIFFVYNCIHISANNESVWVEIFTDDPPYRNK